MVNVQVEGDNDVPFCVAFFVDPSRGEGVEQKQAGGEERRFFFPTCIFSRLASFCFGSVEMLDTHSNGRSSSFSVDTGSTQGAYAPEPPQVYLRSRSPQASNRIASSRGGSSNCTGHHQSAGLRRMQSPLNDAIIGAHALPTSAPMTSAIGIRDGALAVPSYRSIYSSRCSSLGDSPNVTEPRRRVAAASTRCTMRGDADGVHSLPQQPRPRVQRWHASMAHNPTRVLGAPGMIEDAYTQCLSWGSESLAGLLNDQYLLFDVSRPTEVCAAYKLGSEAEDAEGAIGGSSRRLSSVCMRPHNDRESLIGDTRGIVRLLRCREGSSEAFVDRNISISECCGVSVEQQQLTSPSSPVQTLATTTTLHRIHASSVASNMALLFDVSCRSVSCIDASDQHPHLFLCGTAAGVTGLVDTRVCSSSHRAVVAHCRVPAQSDCMSPTAAVPGVGDRVMAVSWNCSGSLFAVGSNTCGVSVWSMANMAEPMTTFGARTPSSWHLNGTTPDSPPEFDRQMGSTCGGKANPAVCAAVRALQFSPSDPFELTFGGGVGDGVIQVVNVVSSRRLYTAATGAQVGQVRYSPCGSMLISSHGIRRQDLPPPPPTPGAGILGDWGGAPDGPCSRRKYCLAVWSRGKTHTTPSMALLATQRNSCGSSTSRRAPISAHHRSASRDSLDEDSNSAASEAESLVSDDEPNSRSNSHDDEACSDCPSSPSSPARARPLQLRIRLDGHTSRPLHLVVPRQRSPHLGSVATAAGGGDDSTIRFWNVFSRLRTRTTSSIAAAASAPVSPSRRSLSPSTVGGLPICSNANGAAAGGTFWDTDDNDHHYSALR